MLFDDEQELCDNCCEVYPRPANLNHTEEECQQSWAEVEKFTAEHPNLPEWWD